MNEKKPGGWRMIMGGILLILALYLGIQFVFWGLEQAIAKRPDTGMQSGQSVSASLSPEGRGEENVPSFCVHCGEGLPESFQWGQFCPYCGKKVE